MLKKEHRISHQWLDCTSCTSCFVNATWECVLTRQVLWKPITAKISFSCRSRLSNQFYRDDNEQIRKATGCMSHGTVAWLPRVRRRTRCMPAAHAAQQHPLWKNQPTQRWSQHPKRFVGLYHDWGLLTNPDAWRRPPRRNRPNLFTLKTHNYSRLAHPKTTAVCRRQSKALGTNLAPMRAMKYVGVTYYTVRCWYVYASMCSDARRYQQVSESIGLCWGR